ncbi:hypothetical protein JY460_06085 [Stenotrophomonas maltophilia]|nr:hypothetical protein [Stenotrophomonas maltophilia]
MNTKKTLADAQPGGRVRLGDQGERARFKAWWDAARPLEGSAFPYEIAWAAWQAALSAQPSPGGQGDAHDCLAATLGDLLLRGWIDDVSGKLIGEAARKDMAAALAARQPSKQPDSVALGEATEFCIEKGNRQPVGEPVAHFVEAQVAIKRLQDAVEGELDGLAINEHQAALILNHVLRPEIDEPLYAAPPAQAVDLGQFRAKVAEFLRSEFDLEVADPEDHRHDDGSGEADRIAGNIVALLDSQAVGK